jgi:hypothetical protein
MIVPESFPVFLPGTTRYAFPMGLRFLRSALTVAALLLPLAVPEARAIVLGELRSSSRVGQVLRAEIDVAEHPAERFDPACLKLYRPESVSDDPQALSEKLAWLEANVAELKRAEERLEGVATALPSTPPAPGGDSALATAKAPTIPLPPASSHRAADVPTTSPAAAAQTGGLAAPPDLRQQLAAAAADSDPWLLFAGLAPVAVLVLLLVLRRQGLAVEARARGPAAFPVSGPGSPEFLRTEPTTTGAIKARGQATEPTLSAAPAPLPAHTGPEIAGAAPALELAEIMLSFGRVSGAAKTLEEYLAALPQESVRPWIRLLQIYQRNGMRDEFEALTLKLNRNFNVEIMRWDGGDSQKELQLLPLDTQQGKAMTLEDIPRIRDQIIALWGRPECPGYLEKLLRDNRDGQRSGFTLPVVEEILFLIDIVATREAAQQFSQNP